MFFVSFALVDLDSQQQLHLFLDFLVFTYYSAQVVQRSVVRPSLVSQVANASIEDDITEVACVLTVFQPT